MVFLKTTDWLWTPWLQVAPDGCVQRMAECMLQLASVSDDALVAQRPSYLAAASLCAALQMAGMKDLLPQVFHLAGCSDPMYLVHLSQVGRSGAEGGGQAQVSSKGGNK
jgi:hypothetical protein